MVALLKKLFFCSLNYIKSIWSIFKTAYLKFVSDKYLIVKNPNEVFEKVYKVKDNTWEDTYYPECYGHCKEQHLSIFSQEEFIYRLPKARVCNESDVVITGVGAYWDKYNDEEFVTWANPSDINVVWYDNTSIIIRRNKKQETISGDVLSMLGVWAPHWGHCLYQFLPKLFTAGEAGLLKKPITILVPESEDANIIEIINNFLANYPKATIKYTQDGVDYICETLFFMPSSGSNFNNSLFRLDYPYYISRHVLDKIKKYVIDPVVDKIKDNAPKYDKIYLSRRGKRTATNITEIDRFFKEQGFVEIEGSKLTLEQKADIFYHAKEVVGMYGSGMINMMFCNQAKSLVLINYRMSTDTSIYLQIRDYVSLLVNVTGQDCYPTYHTDTFYPLEKVKEVYFNYIKTNN